MKLATRISLFFLIAIALVLTGFSGSIYWIVRAHLYRQLNDRSVAAIDTIVASIETGPGGLEWEPNDRSLHFGDEGAGKALVWAVFDGDGHLVDGATEAASMLLGVRDANGGHLPLREDAESHGESWRVSRREIVAAASSSTGENDPATKKYARLLISVGASLGPLADQLRVLALTLGGIAISVWLIAALLGGWLCRNALAPLTQMSASLAAISPADLSRRLPVVATDDQLGELTRAFNQLLDRLEASFDRQRRFAADASHQLRTPLTSMIGQVDVALRRDRSTSEYQSTLECVRDQSARLSRIIEMLLFLAREGADVIWSDCNCFELKDWLMSYLPSWSRHPRFQDIRLVVDAEAEHWIRAHEGLLGQAIDNLIDNACKYSEPNTAIAIRASRVGDNVLLEIEDNGYGISEEELARVRDPFFRSDEVRRKGIGGAGLGLSVAQQIVSAFGSQLSIESTPGRGSIVTIAFRAQARQQTAARNATKGEVSVVG